MRYADGREKSAEFLRLAIPLMTQQAAALHPISYAVWYEYVSGVNRSLRDAIDDLRTRECVLDEETTRSLFRSHVADYDEEAAHKVTQDVQQVLDDMADSAKRARHGLDDLDVAILSELQSDARITHAELARRLSLSGPAIHQRVRRLERQGYVKRVVALLDRELLGIAEALRSIYQANDLLAPAGRSPCHGTHGKG